MSGLAPVHAALRPIALIPAAGSSSRMGRPKLHLAFGDTTILGSTARALGEGGAAEILVVVSPQDSFTAAWAARHGVRIALNPEPARGMLSSVWSGIQALGGAETLAASGRSLLVCPADLPRLRASTVAALLDLARRHGGATVAHPVHEGRRGHPLWIAARRVPEITRLDPGAGLRQIRDLRPAEVLTFDCDDPGTVRDVDTEEDYRQALSDLAP